MTEPLRVAVCENDPKDMALLLSCIAGGHIQAICDEFPSGEDLLQRFYPGKYDVIFLDIYMGGMRGVDVAAEIRTSDRSVTLVFTTVSTEHALEGYRLKAVGYLEKPIRKEDVGEMLALAQARRNTASYITLPVEGADRTFPMESILFFELKNHAVMVHTHTGVLRTSQTVRLQHIEPKLPGHYLRCHHSYIVNLRYVKGINIDLAVFVMQNDERVHIRRKDLKKTLKAYEDCLFASAREQET